MPQLDQLSTCPSCEEPLEEGDRFCGACGTDLEAALRDPAPGAGGPPASVNGVPPRPDALPVTPAPGDQSRPGAREAARPHASPATPPRTPAPPHTAAPASTPTHTPTEPDFALPPAVALPEQAGNGAAAPDERPDASREATTPPPGTPPLPSGPPAAGAPAGAGAPSTPDPRTSDPRTVLDEAPAHEAGQGTAVGGVSSGPEPLGPRCVACGTGTIDNDGYCEHCGHKQPCERDHMEYALGSVAAASDRGLRHHRNEDFFAVAETTTAEGSPATIAVICDGVSSATRPDEASAAAAEAASASLCESVPRGSHPQQSMHDALVAAAEAVNVLADEGPSDPTRNAPACTIVSSLTADGILTVGWVGDSRAYWVPDDRTAPSARLTEDDSWAAQMVAAGLMNEAEAYADSRAHAITGWLGADAYELDPHTASFKPDRPGVVVVCTDGLWNYAESAEEMAAAVPSDALARPLHSAQHLVGYALDGGGHDNVTVAVVPFPAAPGGAGSA
ncbi:PP2C family serine/threonine-protein phosphatase [Streptomyces iconiensis]|uniref:Protein phosphatase 2C domain-containing protein n=1 Tax=Streptomyces iconiensis TaxID=1384038 RepID=A0ABT7A5K3_9ACTN|nr:PP2C family serine/threonine-protein phosphatase [Streptomyces iconiensis]MDJ1136604.1 protein phosphatase 2C domain-containing protein [Streptomyces iconiensis]